MSAWDGTWTTPPASSAPDGDGLLVTCVGGSDFWRTTYYGFERDSGTRCWHRSRTGVRSR